MGRPVIAYHIIFGAYGFWLPNDPRGSQSKYVFAPRLTLFGPPRPLKADAAPRLARLPSPWGEHGWKVYSFDLADIEHAVEYVRANPTEPVRRRSSGHGSSRLTAVNPDVHAGCAAAPRRRGG